VCLTFGCIATAAFDQTRHSIFASRSTAPQECEAFKIPGFFLEKLFTHCDEVTIIALRPPFTLTKIPGTPFCYTLSRYKGYSTAGNIKSIEVSSDLIGNRIRDLPAFNSASG
jgi:hypothetical protein